MIPGTRAQPFSVAKTDLCPGCQDWMWPSHPSLCKEGGSSADGLILLVFAFLQLGSKMKLLLFIGGFGMRNETNFSGYCNLTMAISMLGGSERTASGLFPTEGLLLWKPKGQATPVLRGNLSSLSQLPTIS